MNKFNVTEYDLPEEVREKMYLFEKEYGIPFQELLIIFNEGFEFFGYGLEDD